MKKTYTATEARKQFFKLVRQAAKPGSKITITLEGEEPVVLMAQEELESWMETLEVMSDSQLVKDIKEAEERGDYTPWEDAKKELGWG
jgi:prevent-host-death family protein